MKIKLKTLGFFIGINTIMLICIFLIQKWREPMAEVQISDSEFHLSSQTETAFDIIIINSTKANDRALNLTILKAEEKLSNFFNVVEIANDISEVKSAFQRRHFVEYVAPEAAHSPLQVFSKLQNRARTQFIWFVGHNSEPLFYKNSENNSDFRLDWETPWVGSVSPKTSEIAKQLNQLRGGFRTIYLAPTCYSERIHRLSYQNPNTCGIGNSLWNRVSMFNFADGTALSRFFFDSLDSPRSDFNSDRSTSLFESFVNISRNDFLNYPNVQLSSSAYLRNFSTLPFKNTEKFEPWNTDDQRTVWNRLYRDISSFKITEASVCASVNPAQNTTNTLKALFTESELNLLPVSYKNNLVGWIKTLCASEDRHLLNLEPLIEAEKISGELRRLKTLMDSCSAPGWDGFAPRNPNYLLNLYEELKNQNRTFVKLEKPSFDNCSDLRNKNLASAMDLNTQIRKFSQGLSPLPILVEAKKISEFLKKPERVAIQKKLREILDCENSNF